MDHSIRGFAKEFSFQPFRYLLTSPSLGIPSSPVVGTDGTIFLGSSSGFYAIDGITGALKWSYEISGGVTAQAAIGMDGTVVVGAASDGIVYFFNGDKAVASGAWKTASLEVSKVQ